MSFPPSFTSVLKRAGLCAALVLLGGCAATGNGSETFITTVDRPSVESQLLIGEKRPASVQSTLE